MKEKSMTRTALARRAGVNGETIRFYENRGLLPAPERTAAGYRLYSSPDAARLAFIKRSQELGFTLDEIKDLLSLHGTPKKNSGMVKSLAEAKIKEITERIRDLRRMQSALKEISAECDGTGTNDECPILRALAVNSHE
jgi:MerR family transcriptional regulator, copper efflux regulator